MYQFVSHASVIIDSADSTVPSDRMTADKGTTT